MNEINIPRDQQQALAALDINEIERLIDQAVRMERPGDLRIRLLNCGSYIAKHLHYFQQALARHHEAKAPRKREETGRDVRDAAYDLSHAVEDMRQRMEREQKFAELFFVDDLIMPPFRFSEHLSVRVSYRWCRTVADPWTHGSITFTHQVALRPDYTIPAPKRKPSAAKLEQDRQTTLLQTWEHLMRGALYSLRDYFEDGGDGEKIPDTYQVTVDAYSRGLNNYSTQFWRQQS